MINYVFWENTPDFIAELTDYLKDKKVLEVFAGNGYLASLLSAKGVDITSTSLKAGHDGHDVKMYYPVVEMSANEAVLTYTGDVLLMSWPTTTPNAIKAVELWSKLYDKPFIFIGEVTNYERNELGGCATDEFFEKTKAIHYFDSYQGNYIEKAFVGTLKVIAKER